MLVVIHYYGHLHTNSSRKVQHGYKDIGALSSYATHGAKQGGLYCVGLVEVSRKGLGVVLCIGMGVWCACVYVSLILRAMAYVCVCVGWCVRWRVCGCLAGVWSEIQEIN